MSRKKQYPTGIAGSIQTVYNESILDIEQTCIRRFATEMLARPPQPGSGDYVHAVLNSLEDFSQLPGFSGLYIIASDYTPGFDHKPHSRLVVNGMPAIYRGHASNVRERVMSHLVNPQYREFKIKKGQEPWKQCLKLNDEPGAGGLDITQLPYAEYRWEVVVLPLRGSSERMRELAEWAFDCAFGKPKCCNEKALPPGGRLPALQDEELELTEPA